ncbi:nitrilase [Candidatus Acidianus copahuensis]|uniref:Nitrilase n=1 Tax=Candidatus Acidianus copahuensis TaxID=1160895 RepID=A0A031LL88_9CREN|nr:carbon-nitrogen hydrolase family protein [Candidatus Acidianus copahuensis]EZQ04802.1 nitrilase [Candidatus Acidianus copahuensis]
MKIAIVQPLSAKSGVDLTESALKEGAQLVLLPEKWVKSLEELPIKEFQRLALKYTSYIIPGAVDDGVSIIAPIIDSRGNILAIAKKIHLFGKEKEKLLPGDKLIVFSYGGIKFSVIVCYDADFPEIARASFMRGTEIFLIPSKITSNGYDIWKEYLRVRALENRVSVVNANVYSPPFYPGKSFIVVPEKSGDIVVLKTIIELGDEEGYAIAEINPLSYFNLRISRMKEITSFEVEER